MWPATPQDVAKPGIILFCLEHIYIRTNLQYLKTFNINLNLYMYISNISNTCVFCKFNFFIFMETSLFMIIPKCSLLVHIWLTIYSITILNIIINPVM